MTIYPAPPASGRARRPPPCDRRVMSLAVAASAWAQAGPPQVTVANPLASRVAQWDEFTGRFEATAARRGAPARLRLHRQGAFPRRQHRQTGRPAVHHRPAAVPARGRFGAVRRGAHQGAGGAGRRRLRARPATGEDRGDAGARTRSAQGQPRHRPRAADGGRGGAAHGASSIWNGPRSARRSAAACPTAASIPATSSPAARAVRRC